MSANGVLITLSWFNMAYSGMILIPIFIAVTFVFFRR